MDKALDIKSSTWVSASAGSGKTTILVNRLLMLLINNVDVSKILCITYTRTAAAEMKDRIYKILSQWAIMNDDNLRSDIKNRLNIDNYKNLDGVRVLFAKVIDNIDNLKILTIHSFCQQIIARFPIEAGIYPNFELIDDYQSKELIREAFDTVLMDASIYSYLKKIMLETDNNNFIYKINDIISKRRYIDDSINYEEKLKDILELEYTDENEIFNIFFENCDFSDVIKLKEFIDSKGTDKSKETYSIIPHFLSEKKAFLGDYISIFVTDKFNMRKPLKVVEDDSFMFEVYNTEFFRCINYVLNLEKIKIYTLSEAIIKISLKVLSKYKEIKNLKGVLDFDDLLILTYKLLEDTEYSAWVSYKLDSGIEHLLLDEAQDTSFLQWKIIEKLTEDFFVGDTKSEKDRTIFVVGDEKQSIFKFQGANPEMFEEEYYYYKNLITNAHKNFHKIRLDYSYRSLKEILVFIDTVFKDSEYAKKISKLEDKIEHKNIRDGVGYVELWPLIEYIDEEDEEKNLNELVFENSNESKQYILLSKYIVQKIKSLIGHTIVTRNGSQRKAKYDDIMILSRKRNKQFLSILISELNKNKIPNSGQDRIDLFDNIIIKDIISLLTFLVFNNDDLSLANIIKSPILSLTEDDLFNLCVYKNENNVTLFDALKLKFEEKYNFLSNLIAMTNEASIYDIVFYTICNCKKNILDRFGNEANLIIEKFYDFILNFEKNYSTSLVSFISFVINNKNDIKKDIDVNDDDCVKIMTVHASKGLQSPIVFLCEASVSDGGAADKNLWFNETPIYNKKSLATDEIKDFLERDSYAEYCRLLYVALTRAENELYICGVVKNKKQDKNMLSWYNLAKNALVNLNGKVCPFDFDETLEKIVYGELEGLDIFFQTSMEDRSFNLIELKEYVDTKANNKNIIAPSQFYNHIDKDAAFAAASESILIGKAVHKLLEILPNVNNKNKVADVYLNNMFAAIKNKEFVKNQVLSLMDKFSEFFSNKSRAEVPIIGEVDDFIVSGRIDRLIEYDDKVVVLDYKNTKKHYKTMNDLPQAYIKQLDLYKKLLEKIYINKKVICYILITSYGELIEISN